VRAPALTRWARTVRPQDVVWVLLFLLLAIPSEYGDLSLYLMLAALAAVQVTESRAPALASTRGRILGLVLKFGISFLLIGYTGGIESRYWLVLLLPVVSSGMTFGILGTLAVTLLAGVLYLSFLSFVDLTRYELDGAGLVARVIFLAMIVVLAVKPNGLFGSIE